MRRQRRTRIRMLLAVLFFAVMMGAAVMTIYGREKVSKKSEAENTIWNKYTIDRDEQFCTIYECEDGDNIYYIMKWIIRRQ